MSSVSSQRVINLFSAVNSHILMPLCTILQILMNLLDTVRKREFWRQKIKLQQRKMQNLWRQCTTQTASGSKVLSLPSRADCSELTFLWLEQVWDVGCRNVAAANPQWCPHRHFPAAGLTSHFPHPFQSFANSFIKTSFFFMELLWISLQL